MHEIKQFAQFAWIAAFATTTCMLNCVTRGRVLLGIQPKTSCLGRWHFNYLDYATSFES